MELTVVSLSIEGDGIREPHSRESRSGNAGASNQSTPPRRATHNVEWWDGRPRPMAAEAHAMCAHQIHPARTIPEGACPLGAPDPENCLNGVVGTDRPFLHARFRKA